MEGLQLCRAVGRKQVEVSSIGPASRFTTPRSTKDASIPTPRTAVRNYLLDPKP